MKIAVVGAGPAGLTAAAFAAQLGLDTTLYSLDRIDSPKGGVILHHNGQRVLQALGLADDIVASGQSINSLNLRVMGDKSLASVRFENLPPTVVGPAAVTRQTIYGALRRAAVSAGCRIVVGARVVGVWMEGERAHIQTEEGGDEAFDVVLACDGSRSTVRDAMGLAARVQPPRDAWLRGALGSNLFSDDSGVIDEFWGLNLARFGSVLNPKTNGFFWCTVPMGEWDIIRDSRLEEWLTSWEPLAPEVARRLSSVEDWSSVDYVEVADVDLSTWFAPPIFALGDAAHACGPFLGQGLNSAMVDACVLVQLLARSRTVKVTLEEIGRTWENVRRPIVGRTRSAAKQLSAVAGVTSAPARALRDLLIPVASRLDLMGPDLLKLTSGFNPIEEAYFHITPPVDGR